MVIPASAELESAAVARYRRPFETKFFDYWGMNPAKMPGGDTAVNVPGTPGVFLYLLPLGTGQSKGDNLHHWGYPEHSFWCCYGAAVESFAKLADSIYFWDRGSGDQDVPRLYINQLVSSSLAWRELGIAIGMSADMYMPGPSATAAIGVNVPGGGTVLFSLMLRLPVWADPANILLAVNGEPWSSCPGAPKPSSYCAVTRAWASGDKLSVVLGLKYWLRPLPDSRPEYEKLTAVMMGPFVMAGLTHDTRWLELVGSDLPRAMAEPDDHEELVSLQAGWNASLYVRHDAYHGHMSEMEDGGDAIDATFRLVRGCVLTPSVQHGHGVGAHGAKQDQMQHMHHQMKVGLHDDNAVMLESMNYPGFYLGVIGDDKWLTLTQPASMRGVDSKAYCSGHQFMLRPGLDQAPGTVSLESVAHAGSVLSAHAGSTSACDDDTGLDCSNAAKQGWCVAKPDVYKVYCRKSCGTCAALSSALSLQTASDMHDGVDAALSSFRMAQPLTRQYPPGSKVMTGSNRRYLVVPLGNVIDERYTVYFDMKPAP
uniref:ShKT domain-containing protein n=1 Tax=Chlamydomonas euryale TaxID=1486919 RepID=A0A7R9VKV4_9CHLO